MKIHKHYFNGRLRHFFNLLSVNNACVISSYDEEWWLTLVFDLIMICGSIITNNLGVVCYVLWGTVSGNFCTENTLSTMCPGRTLNRTAVLERWQALTRTELNLPCKWDLAGLCDSRQPMHGSLQLVKHTSTQVQSILRGYFVVTFWRLALKGRPSNDNIELASQYCGQIHQM